MAKLFKNILGIVITAILLWYLVRHWDQTKELLRLSVLELALIYFVALVGVLNSALVDKIILKPMGVSAMYSDMLLLQNASLLLNYAPMKFGTLFRANYFKKHYGLKYSHFGVFSLYLAFILSTAASAIGVIVMVFVYGLADIQRQILTVVFTVCGAASLLLIVVPLPVPKSSAKIMVVLRDFIIGRKTITSDTKTVCLATFFLFLNFVLTAVRLAIIYHSMGKDIHPAGYLILGALGYVMMFISLTPGAIGIREVVLGAGATVLGISFEVGITAAMIDRAVALAWSFLIGGICTAIIWHKSPSDFKETKTVSQ